MFDIEIIEDRQVALVTPESLGAQLIRAMNSALVMKRLSSEDSGRSLYLTSSEVAAKCSKFLATNITRDLGLLHTLGLVEVGRTSICRGEQYHMISIYTFTDFGLEICRRLKDGEEEIQIPIYN